MLLRLLLLTCAPLCEPAVLLLTARPPRPTEGTAVTLTCETWLPPQQADVQLQFCFFRDDRALEPGWSRSPELQVSAVWSEDSVSYRCEAQAAGSTVGRSKPIQVQVQRVSIYNVSLETRPPGGHVVEGQKLVLVCLAAGGTGDVTFVWYKGALGLTLETKTQRSLTAEFELPAVKESDAEQYYCAADNGRGPCLSGLVSVTVAVPAGDRKRLTLVIVEGLLSTLGLGTAALLFCCWLKRKVGRRSTGDAPRSPAVPPPRESTYFNSAVPTQTQPAYENVSVVGGDEVYSLVYHLQQARPSAAAEPLRTEPEDQYSAVIYAGLKKPCVTDEDYEDAM